MVIMSKLLEVSLILVLCVSIVGCTSSPRPVIPTTTPTTSPGSVSIDLVAKNIAFDKSTITVLNGTRVTINFDNQDVGTQHNFALYDPVTGYSPIFVGEVITGPKKVVYTFIAPLKPGQYSFQCDIHPNLMYGNFVVI